MREFRAFALRGNAVDLAIAVALGAAFTAVVNSIVKNLFTPIIGVIFNKDFSTWTFSIRGSEFNYGAVINAIITFVVVAIALFFFVVKPLNALRNRFHLDIDPDAPIKTPCPACRSEIDPLARRCPFCTEELAAGWAPEAAPVVE
jgi:large conductance mechanosensitive channel